MSAEHKRPLLAFVLVAIACMLILANALRTEAVRGYLEDGASRVVAGVGLALDHPSAPQPVVAPPVAAAPFDRLDPAVPSGSPTPASSAPTTTAPAPLPTASVPPSVPPAPPVPAGQASVEAPVDLARAGVAHRVHRAAHRVSHRVHRVSHRVHRATRAVQQRVHRVAHRAVRQTPRVAHRAVPHVTEAVSRPVTRGLHRALGHAGVRGAPWAALSRPAPRAPHGRAHAHAHHGHAGKHHGHAGKHRGHSGRR